MVGSNTINIHIDVPSVLLCSMKSIEVLVGCFLWYTQTMLSINQLLEKADKIYRQQVNHRNDLDQLLVCLASGTNFPFRTVSERRYLRWWAADLVMVGLVRVGSLVEVVGLMRV